MSVDVQIASSHTCVPAAALIEEWARRALAGEVGDMCIRVVDESESHELNSRYRNVDKPTNVLSFPTGGVEVSGAGSGGGDMLQRMLGDVVVCAPIVASEAERQNKRLDHHFAHMVVHGVLHLLGFDHQNDRDADVMEAREQQILAEQGIADPYAVQ